jgi:hypothetical protein
VAEVGLEREQHYYTLPKGWQPPASFFMESYQIMVFGEGGVVLTPPSLEPQVQSNLRWLRPPWESPPIRPSPGLCNFIKQHAPVLPQTPIKEAPAVIPWGEIYPVISSHPQVLQALLAPAATSEGYYQYLLRAAAASGIEDAQVLLGLLWHAPLGNSHNHPQRAEYLMGLVKQTLAGVETAEAWEPPTVEGREESGLMPEGLPARPESRGKNFLDAPQFERFAPPATGMPTERSEGQPAPGTRAGRPGRGELHEAWSEMWRFSQENLIVERHRYEAMIYELGKLGALHDFFKGEHRQNKRLKDKLESQWIKELEYLRQLVAPKNKKGWYRSWRQE